MGFGDYTCIMTLHDEVEKCCACLVRRTKDTCACSNSGFHSRRFEAYWSFLSLLTKVLPISSILGGTRMAARDAIPRYRIGSKRRKETRKPAMTGVVSS